MRVALIALHFAEYAARLALALAARGETIQLHLSAKNAARELDQALLARLSGAVDLRLQPHPARKYAAAHGARIAAALRGFRPDVIHAQEASEWTLFAARTLGPRAPFVLTVHDPLAHSGDDSATRRRTAWPNARLRCAADAIIVHGRRMVEDMARAEPGAAAKTYSVMHGILGDPAPNPPPRDPRMLLFFGRIEAYKGLGVLVDASERLAADGVRFRLTVAGRGQDLPAHRAAIAALPQVQLDDRYIPADEVPLLFAEAGAVVMPYLDASQSGVAAYAFAAGAPVIASSVGALPEIVRDGINGLLVPPGDATALAGAMARLLGEPGLAASLSAGAAETAATTLSWGRIAEETRAVYAAVAGRKRKLLM